MRIDTMPNGRDPGISELENKDDLLHAAMGLCTESGELMDVLKKHRYYGKPIDWVNVVEEIGDTAWYLALACRAAGTTLEEVCMKNIAKLRARYPEKFTQEAALNRNVESERAILETPSVGTGVNRPA